ncbi:MAG TPA: GNAT family N-acetyltransferase [Vicinamibacteria bacterium]
MSVPESLRTERLTLRPMAAEDAAELQRQWNDPRVGRFLWDGRPVAAARVRDVIAASEADFAARGFGLWALLLGGDAGAVVGFSGLRVEAESGRVELLFALDPAAWGRGLATEAARAVLDDAFRRLRLPRVFAGANPANEASLRVLERVGMHRLGSRQTALEELVLYAADRDPSGAAAASSLERLRTQLDALPVILGDASAEALRRPRPSGEWSAHENLAHMARQQEVFRGRLERILAEEAPALPQYRAEDDPEWPAWAALATGEVLARLRAGRAELVGALGRLAPGDLERTGVHARLGAMPLALWIEFFLVHEAHHLYTILRRVRGAD